MKEPFVYDKAKYHYQRDYPKDLPIDQSFVHTGLFLGWIVDHDLYDQNFVKETGEEYKIVAFKRREITGPKLFESFDGVLIDEMLSEEGNAFAQYYFDFEKGQYLQDYDELLSSGLPSMYHVRDTWQNYQKLKTRIDQRYEDWKKTKRSSWKFWV